MNIPPECQKIKSNKIIVLQENRSRIIFNNPNQEDVRKIHVDGCAVNDNVALRCDYLLIRGNRIEIYVELKGSDIGHAVRQIEATINRLSDDVQNARKYCFVVSTRVPRQSTSIQQIQSRFKRKFNASLRIKNIQDNCDLESLG